MGAYEGGIGSSAIGGAPMSGPTISNGFGAVGIPSVGMHWSHGQPNQIVAPGLARVGYWGGAYESEAYWMMEQARNTAFVAQMQFLEMQGQQIAGGADRNPTPIRSRSNTSGNSSAKTQARRTRTLKRSIRPSVHDSITNRSGLERFTGINTVSWPAYLAMDADLLQRRQAADRAVMVVLKQFRLSGRAECESVTEAKSKLREFQSETRSKLGTKSGSSRKIDDFIQSLNEALDAAQAPAMANRNLIASEKTE